MIFDPPIKAPNGIFNKDQRVWVLDRFGLRAGHVWSTGHWTCEAGTKSEYKVPYIKVYYDEIFDPLGIMPRREGYFWREDELKTIYPQSFLSNCCEAKITGHDARGHGRCRKCGDTCTPIEPEDNVTPHLPPLNRGGIFHHY